MIQAHQEDIPEVKREKVNDKVLRQAVTHAIEIFMEDFKKEKEREEKKSRLPKGAIGFGRTPLQSETFILEPLKASNVEKSNKKKGSKKKSEKEVKMGNESSVEFLDASEFVGNMSGSSSHSGCNERWVLWGLETFGYKFLFELSISSTDEKFKLLKKYCNAGVWKRFYDLVHIVNFNARVQQFPSLYDLRESRMLQHDVPITLFADGFKVLCHVFFNQADLVDQAKIYKVVSTEASPDRAISYQELIIKEAISDSESSGIL